VVTASPGRFAMYLGILIQGDIGPITMYRSKRGKLVAFAKAPPTEPASPLQRVYRGRWRSIAALWSGLPAATKAAWRQLALQAHLRITGYNLYMYVALTGDDATLETLVRTTGIDPRIIP